MTNTDVVQKIQDALQEPVKEKDKAELFFRTLGAYFDQLAQLNDAYGAELEDAIEDLEYLDVQKARLTE